VDTFIEASSRNGKLSAHRLPHCTPLIVHVFLPSNGDSFAGERPFRADEHFITKICSLKTHLHRRRTG